MKKLLGIVVLSLLWCNTSFAGCIEGDCRNGKGTETWANGDKYVGEYNNGKKHGQGTYTWANGAKYVGEWRNNKRNGQGTKTWPDGTKYVGEFKDSRLHGQGTLAYSDGGKYVGEFRNGKQHGQGTSTYADGSVAAGTFKKGELVKRKKLSKKEKAAAKDEPGHVYYKDEKLIHVKFSWGSTAERVAIAHCSSLGKFAFQFYGDGLEYSGNSARIYHCSRSNLSKSPTSGGKFLWTNYDENHEFAQQQKEVVKFEKVEGYKTTCQSLGFETGTEKFADCALKLFIADNKGAQIVQSSSGAQEIIIYDPERERRIRAKTFNDLMNGKCELNSFSEKACQW